VLCVNICVPSSALKKPNIVLSANKGLLGLGKSWLTNRIDTREWEYPFKGEPLVYLS